MQHIASYLPHWIESQTTATTKADDAFTMRRIPVIILGTNMVTTCLRISVLRYDWPCIISVVDDVQSSTDVCYTSAERSPALVLL